MYYGDVIMNQLQIYACSEILTTLGERCRSFTPRRVMHMKSSSGTSTDSDPTSEHPF